jgi:hypothetical protein
VVDPEDAVLRVVPAVERVYGEVRDEVVVVTVDHPAAHGVAGGAHDLVPEPVRQPQLVGVGRLHRFEERVVAA